MTPAIRRRRGGIGDDALRQSTLHKEATEITPVVAKPAHGSAWARKLHAMFAPIRAGALQMSEAEIDAEVDAAVAEVRAQTDS